MDRSGQLTRSDIAASMDHELSASIAHRPMGAQKFLRHPDLSSEILRVDFLQVPAHRPLHRLEARKKR